jgi:hypothetical protein
MFKQYACLSPTIVSYSNTQWLRVKFHLRLDLLNHMLGAVEQMYYIARDVSGKTYCRSDGTDFFSLSSE